MVACGHHPGVGAPSRNRSCFDSLHGHSTSSTNRGHSDINYYYLWVHLVQIVKIFLKNILICGVACFECNGCAKNNNYPQSMVACGYHPGVGAPSQNRSRFDSLHGHSTSSTSCGHSDLNYYYLWVHLVQIAKIFLKNIIICCVACFECTGCAKIIN